jgi:DamX protein
MTDRSTYDTEKLDRLEPAYLANYGLTEAPFSNLHDDRFLYLDAERAQRLNLLQHMTQYSNLLLIVQGEHGVGKTSLLSRFIKNKAGNWHICEVTANTMMDAGQLLFQAAQGFGLEQLPQDSGELQEMLYARVAELHHGDQIPLLVIDDAHELPKDALLAIFHLADAQVDDANLLRIILFAEPQIEKILNAKDVRPLRERITHTMEIPPLDEDTTAEYLKHRMAVAGFNGGSPFTPKMVKRIYKASAGIPERINKLAHETLDKGDFEREEAEEIVVPAQQPRRRYQTTVLIGIAVVAIALVLVFQSRINRLFEDKPAQTKTLPIPLAENTPAIQPAPQPAPTPTPKTPPATLVTQVPAPATAEKPPVQEKIIPLQTPPATPSTQPVAPAPTSAEATKQTAPLAEKPAVTPVLEKPEAAATPQPPLPTLRVQSVTPDPVPAGNTPQTIMLHGEGFTPESRVFVSWANKDHEIPPARVKLINDKQLQVKLTVGTQHDKWQVHVTDANNGNSNTLAFRVATPALLRQQTNDWVLAQEPGKFTLQLFGSHEQKNAETFIRRHKLGKQAKVFISERKGKDWYSVIYNVYPDQAAARSASRTLPASLKKIKPWVRRFDDIQTSINVARKTLAKPHKSTARPASKPAVIFTTALPKDGDIKQYASWLWSQDPRYFTLQLTGARELASVKKFQRKYAKLDGHAIYFHTRHAGRDWYAVVYGVYPNRQKAREAIKRLPPELQKVSPWIRSFASIHAELARTE